MAGRGFRTAPRAGRKIGAATAYAPLQSPFMTLGGPVASTVQPAPSFTSFVATPPPAPQTTLPMFAKPPPPQHTFWQDARDLISNHTPVAPSWRTASVAIVIIVCTMLLLTLYAWNGALQGTKADNDVWDDVDTLKFKTQNMDVDDAGDTVFEDSVAVEGTLTAARLVVGSPARKRAVAAIPRDASSFNADVYVIEGRRLFAWNASALAYFDLIAAAARLREQFDATTAALLARVDALETANAALEAAVAALEAQQSVFSIALTMVSSQLGSRLVFNGTWTGAATYAPNDVVAHNNSFWLALATSTNSAPTISNSAWLAWQASTTTSAAGAVGLVFNGTWSSSPTYPPSSVVTHNNSFWISLASNTNSAPTISNSNWVGWTAQSQLVPVVLNGTGAVGFSAALNGTNLPLWNSSLNTPYALIYNRDFLDSVPPGAYMSGSGDITIPAGRYSIDVTMTIESFSAYAELLIWYLWIEDSAATILQAAEFADSNGITTRGRLLLSFMAQFAATTTLTLRTQLYVTNGTFFANTFSPTSTLSIQQQLT